MNKIIWIVVGLLVLVTMVLSFTAPDSHSHENYLFQTQPTPPATVRETPDFSKYGIADYDTIQPQDPREWERRRRINHRYDNEGWVIKYPHPDDGKIGRHTEFIPPPAIPTVESDLIVTGKVVGVEAHLSNDKRGVYSEFRLKVDQVLKNDLPVEIHPKALVTFDRGGGVVRYPNGQVVLYLDGEHGLPEVGREYALFLRADGQSDNYAIVTLYELQTSSTVPLDHGRQVEDLRRMGKSGFLQTVREKLSRPGADSKSKGQQ